MLRNLLLKALVLCPVFIVQSIQGTTLSNTAYPSAVNVSIDRRLSFIGEVRGRTYIKIELLPVVLSSDFEGENTEQLKYKGSYFESATGKKYILTAVFNAEDRSWILRCFDEKNQLIYIFNGKQKQDGDIEGVCKGKAKIFSFYLRPA